MPLTAAAPAVRRSRSAGLEEVVGDPADRGPTAADIPALLERLGGIDPARVRLRPVPGTANAEAARVMHDRGVRCELIDGTLIEKAMSDWTGLQAGLVLTVLNNWVLPRGLGGCHGADGFFHFGDDLRGPDCSFTPKGRRSGPLLLRGYSDVPPALVVEAISPGNTAAEMARKRGTYFAHGVDRVWELDRDAAGPLVRVYSAVEEFVTLRSGDMLTGEPVLPGFAVAVADLFVDPFAEDGAEGEPRVDG